jgi:hypothetical protein
MNCQIISGNPLIPQCQNCGKKVIKNPASWYVYEALINFESKDKALSYLESKNPPIGNLSFLMVDGEFRKFQFASTDGTCRGCSTVFYCSIRCEQANLQDHKPQCRKFYERRHIVPFAHELADLFAEKGLINILFQYYRAWWPTDKQDAFIDTAIVDRPTPNHFIFGKSLIQLDRLRLLMADCDRDFALAMVSRNGRVLECAPLEIQDDREIILSADKINRDLHSTRVGSVAMQFASKRLQADKDLILTMASRVLISSFHFVAPELWSDREFVLALLKHAPNAYSFINSSLHMDRNFILAAVRMHGSLLGDVLFYQKDKEICLAAYYSDYRAFRHFSPEFKDDRNLILALLEINGNALQYVCEEFKGDKEIVLTACKDDARIFRFASPALQSIGLERLRNGDIDQPAAAAAPSGCCIS